ncbi:hypothetical protein BG004_003230 [Podila humilis]|nr:hypothetical protein BG004_003230 [Podila humilis]
MDPDTALNAWHQLSKRRSGSFIQLIQKDIIQSQYIEDAPFGKKKATYTDWFASGKPLKTFESIMMESVLPHYANTHTTTTSSAKRTTYSTKASRDTIARCLNVNTSSGHRHEAAVVFCGDGSTAAVAKVRNALRLTDEAFWAQKAAQTTLFANSNKDAKKSGDDTATHSTSTYPTFNSSLAPVHRPVVFLSIQEHHSNLLPWRESCADVVVIREDQNHRIDLTQLELQLQLHQDRPLKIGTFSAGSNLTGVLNDTVAISELLHKYKAFAFFDYAGVGAYTAVDMNPCPSNPQTSMADSLAYKDAVFLSPHKLVGGPGSSGILAARIEVFTWASTYNTNATSEHPGLNDYVPFSPGGGTVDMVLDERHKYTNNILAREEAGTPNILATIRTGLVFRLQEIMNPVAILAKEYQLSSAIFQRLAKHSNISILGTPELNRVAVFCAMVHIPNLSSLNRPLQIHYTLLSMIMNDFFGVEMRGGCMCAGPYASKLLKFDKAKEDMFWDLLMGNADKYTEGNGVASVSRSPPNAKNGNFHKQDLVNQSLKPGFVRFSFPYFAREKDVEFVLRAIEWVAEYGYLLIPFYKVDAQSGKWSLRPSVYRAARDSISDRKLSRGSREDYIPIAVSCIEALYRAIEHQDLIRQPQAPCPGTFELDAEVRSGEFYTQSQAHCSVPGSLRGSSSLSIPYPHVFVTQPPVPSIIESRSGDSLDSLDLDSRHASISLPNSSLHSWASVNASRVDAMPITKDRPPTNRGSSNNASGPNTSSRLSRLSNTRLSPRTFPGKSRYWSAALDELSAENLTAEQGAIEHCPLAKELRWFATPLEVIEFYRRMRSEHRFDYLPMVE